MRIRTAAAASLSAAALVLTACNSNSGETPNGDNSSDGIHTIDPMGNEVSLDSSPQAALGFYTTDVDILATLGIPLASSQPVREGYEGFPDFFPQDALSNVTDVFISYPEYDFESVANADPDFILNGLGYDDTVHPKLTDVAPTYTTNAFDGESWRVHFEQTATDLGYLDEYIAWTQEFDDAVSETQRVIDDAEQGSLTVAPLGFLDGTFFPGCGSTLLCEIFESLGLGMAEVSTDGTEELSMENLHRLQEIDAVWYPVSAGDESVLQDVLAELEQNSAWNDLPFVKNNRIYTYDLEMRFGSPSGAMAFLDRVRDDLTS